MFKLRYVVWFENMPKPDQTESFTLLLKRGCRASLVKIGTKETLITTVGHSPIETQEGIVQLPLEILEKKGPKERANWGSC